MLDSDEVRIRQWEMAGMTRSDAQAKVEAEDMTGTPDRGPWSKHAHPITEHEIAIPLPNGLNMVVENNYGTTYVRFVDSNGFERVMWESTEWAESPEEVMGAIAGVINTPKSDIPE